MTISISSSGSTILASLASSMSESVMTWKGFGVGLIQHGELFLAFEAILGWGGGASIRHGAFI